MADILENKSEVVRLMQQIEQEYEAAHQGLFGLSQGTVRHDFIQAKMEHVEMHHAELVSLVGEKEAAALLCQINDESFERVRVQEGGVARYSRECEYSALYSMAMQRFLLEQLGHLYPQAIRVPGLQHVLDVSCCSGAWAIEMARQHPQAQVLGIDHITSLMDILLCDVGFVNVQRETTLIDFSAETSAHAAIYCFTSMLSHTVKQVMVHLELGSVEKIERLRQEMLCEMLQSDFCAMLCMVSVWAQKGDDLRLLQQKHST